MKSSLFATVLFIAPLTSGNEGGSPDSCGDPLHRSEPLIGSSMLQRKHTARHEMNDVAEDATPCSFMLLSECNSYSHCQLSNSGCVSKSVPEIRVACEHVGHSTLQDCTLNRVGVCYGKVKYGHGQSFSAWKDMDGSFSCETKTFGGDPIYGQAKECICQGSQSLPDNWPVCPGKFRAACENPRHWTFPGCTEGQQGYCIGKVKFGFDTKWTTTSMNGAFSCTNGNLGPDPAPGQAKECICECQSEISGAQRARIRQVRNLFR